MKKAYKRNGKLYKSMMDIARELGKSRVYPKDFDKLGIECIEVEDTKDITVAYVQQQLELKTTDSSSSETKDTKEVKKRPKKVKSVTQKKVVKESSKSVKRLGTPKEIAEALQLVNKVSVTEFSEYIKHFSLKSLVKMAKKAEVKTWDKIENEAIRRMRLIMSLKRHFYPTTSTTPRKPSQWKHVPLENLIKLASSLGLVYRLSSNDNIQRMWVINALNTAGITPNNLDKSIGNIDLGILDSIKRCDNNQTINLH